MGRPLIGITTYLEPASWAVWHQVPAVLLPAAYVRAVQAAGGTALLIPPLGPGDRADDVVARLDGLLVAGGADMNPTRYGEAAWPETMEVRDDRDASELALLDAAADRRLPVLGICRGMQVMAVHAGGRLHQHLPELTGGTGHSPGGEVYGPVAVTTVPGTRLAAAIGDAAVADCHHHQAVVEHPGFVPAAFAADGTLEAMERPGDRFEVAVQWHPEIGADRRLFTSFVAAGAAYRHP